jgi:enoyl-CoA hydratase/carnithine racemase
MPRVLGVDIPNDKPTYVALQYLHGIGQPKASRHLAYLRRAGVVTARPEGKVISGREAFNIGLVNAVVPDGTALDEARGFAAKILAHPRDGVAANKRAMVAATQAALEAALDHAAEVQPERFTSEEFRHYLRSRRS